MDRLPYRIAIDRQPEAIAACRRAIMGQVAELDVAALQRGPVVLTGVGASLYAAEVAAAQMRQQGLRAFALPAAALLDASVNAGEAYIAFSASGRSVEPVNAMVLRPTAATYGIAQADGTPLARAVQRSIATGSGPDSSPNTTSFMGSLLAAALLTDRAGRSSATDWALLPDRAAAVLADTRDMADRAAKLLSGKRAIDCVGTGCALGMAGYAALLVREAVRVPAQGWDTLNFLHGPMEPNDGTSGVLLFGDGREIRLAVDLADFGIATALVTTRVDIGDRKNLVVIRVPALSLGIADIILQMIPAQLIVAALSEAAGIPVCRFRYRQTDTKLTT